ncbi:hypothetical protein D9619_008239 [Psilocybe cf. subviscida]|uniref:Uncharacterized protein n=1 Tax=Psilocybe cf. subviscida TaxID=2480587 RepID=A0A8H5ATP4_9AGAR|nr:hypothetical protein D9619_008239 [Psilocybe cf. subviscida]
MSSSHPQPPKLPLDIIRYLLDLLLASQDFQSLKAFASTCTEYAQPARRLLFHQVALRLDTQPTPTSISDISRRIQGLCVMFTRSPETRSYIQRFVLLDSYPVYNSDWITQQPRLSNLVGMLTNVRQLTLGCSVGYLDALRLPPELMEPLERLIKQPQLKMLTLINIRFFPQSFLQTHAAFLFAINAHTSLLSGASTAPFSGSRLKYLNVRTESPTDTDCVGHLIQIHRRHLKMVKWRCWEDPRITRSASFPVGGVNVDLGTLRALKKLVLRVSFGSIAADLSGFLLLMNCISRPSPLTILEIIVVCPEQRTDTALNQVYHHDVWRKFVNVLESSMYRSLCRVTLAVTVHQFKVVLPNGHSSTSLVELKQGLEKALSRVINISTLHFTLSVHRFFPDSKDSDD